MATLSTTRNYADGDILLESDLDAFLDDIETFLNSTKINDDNIQNGGITGSTKLANASVTNSKMAANAIDTTNIVNDAVTNAKVADNAIDTAQIVDDAVTNAKVADNAIDTDQIVDGAVDYTKLGSANVQQDTTLATGSSGTNHPLLSVSITTTGRPVAIVIRSGIESSREQELSVGSFSASANYTSIVKRDTTEITRLNNETSDSTPDMMKEYNTFIIDSPSAGTYTYSVVLTTTTSVTFTKNPFFSTEPILTVYEL